MNCKTLVSPGVPQQERLVAAPARSPHALTWCCPCVPSPADVEAVSAGSPSQRHCTHIFHEHSLFVVIPQWNYTYNVTTTRLWYLHKILVSSDGSPRSSAHNTNTLVILQRTRWSLTSGKRHRYIVPHPLLSATSTALVSRCNINWLLDVYDIKKTRHVRLRLG